MHNFVYLAQRRSQEFSCEPNLGGRAPPLAAPLSATVSIFVSVLQQQLKPYGATYPLGRVLQHTRALGREVDSTGP